MDSIEKIPVFWGEIENETLSAETEDDAIESILDEMEAAGGEVIPIHMLPEKIIIAGFARMEAVAIDSLDLLETALERLDEDYGDPDGDATKPTDAMRQAEAAFLAVIKREYKPWTCEEVCRKEIDVREWIKANRPDWLNDGL